MGSCLSQAVFFLGRAASSVGLNLGLSPSSASSWSRAAGSSYSSRAAKRQIVVLDAKQKGSAVTVSNFHVAGEGTVLGSAALYQDRAYWEVAVVRPGCFGLGVARRCPSTQLSDLNATTFDGGRSWGAIFGAEDPAGGEAEEEVDRSNSPFGDLEVGDEFVDLYEGDVVAVAFDQSDMPRISYFLNGKELCGKRVHGKIKGVVFPAFAVSGDSMLNVIFNESDFKGKMPDGFSGIIPARDVL